MNANLNLALVALGLGLGLGLVRGAELGRPEADLTPGAVIERGPHHNVLRTFRLELAGDGQLVSRPSRVVQLEDGVNYWEEDQAQWSPSVAEIEIV